MRVDNVVRSFKASGFPDKPVEGLTLAFDHEPPDLRDDPNWEKNWRRLYEAEGDRVEAALFAALPGGLYDQILRAMLARKASLLKVSHAS
jgi:hypothetical protein